MMGVGLLPSVCRVAHPETGMIVANALAFSAAGLPYMSGQPPNTEPDKDGKTPNFGGIFDLSKLNGTVDCSGLVSYAAGLRKRYTTKTNEI